MTSRILKNIHETAKGLYKCGAFNKKTMHEFDILCLEPINKKMKPKDIQKVRLRENISQPVFASYLNVTPSTVKKWETGENVPSGAALRLLQIIDRNGLDVIQVQGKKAS